MYTDVLMVEHARGSDLSEMLSVARYDYGRQGWTVGQDHAHMVGETFRDADTGPLVYCGVLWAGCTENGKG